MLKLIAEKLNFDYNITVPKTFYAAIKLVCDVEHILNIGNEPGIFFTFQSTDRNADLVMTRAVYRPIVALRNDYLRPLGTYDFRFVTANPDMIQNYLTLINPFDGYVWAFLLASVVAVSITFTLIDTTYASWSNTSKKDILYQSKYSHMAFTQERGGWQKEDKCGHKAYRPL